MTLKKNMDDARDREQPAGPERREGDRAAWPIFGLKTRASEVRATGPARLFSFPLFDALVRHRCQDMVEEMG
jgi:hypothetical protein